MRVGDHQDLCLNNFMHCFYNNDGNAKQIFIYIGYLDIDT